MIESHHFKQELTEQERRDWLRLIRSENVGPVTFHRLLSKYGSASSALDALPELARMGGKISYRLYPERLVDLELERLIAAGANLVASCEKGYPDSLRFTVGAPPLISVAGNTHLLQNDSIAIVGARNASANGMGFARALAADIGKGGYGHNNLVIVSGMARGIDTAAHQGGLRTGTIAVLAGGVDVVYPRENQKLYSEIRDQGVVVAEMAVGTKPTARMFPVRNRIIAGLSRGVVVVEASPRSGSLITARAALEQGRDVFAVPGTPGDPRARGTNGLIRDGAILTESASDVLEALSETNFLEQTKEDLFYYNKLESDDVIDSNIDQARCAIKELLGNSSVAVDELVRNCQFSIPTVHAVLLELELAGRLERHPGNRVCLILKANETEKQSLS